MSCNSTSVLPKSDVSVGNVFAASGDRVEARKYFSQALKIEPENVQATMLLAGLEEVEGNPEKAVALYKKLTEGVSKSINPLLALAKAVSVSDGLLKESNKPVLRAATIKTVKR